MFKNTIFDKNDNAQSEIYDILYGIYRKEYKSLWYLKNHNKILEKQLNDWCIDANNKYNDVVIGVISINDYIKWLNDYKNDILENIDSVPKIIISENEMISLNEYAIMHGKAYSSVRQKAQRNGFKTAIKKDNKWLINKYEPYIKNKSGIKHEFYNVDEIKK